MNHKEIITADFKAACRDYYYLLSREYPERSSLKMTGDRYMLSRDQRSVLYRGISSRPISAVRNARLIMPSPQMKLIVDGYNVLFTILNYRLGRMVFISTDGILRDAGSLHGKLRDDTLFLECIEDLFLTILPMRPVSVELFLDSPVTSSRRHYQLILQKLTDSGLPGTCTLVHSADQEIRTLNSGVLASSDTELIGKTTTPVVDLARLVLINRYGAELFRLNELLDQIR
jgi:hypothetical protein